MPTRTLCGMESHNTTVLQRKGHIQADEGDGSMGMLIGSERTRERVLRLSEDDGVVR